MGYYINPEEGTKEEWLEKYGEKLEKAPEEYWDKKKNTIAVILVKNPGFTAAAIAYKQEELVYFRDTTPAEGDYRPRIWFMVPVDLLKPFMKGLGE